MQKILSILALLLSGCTVQTYPMGMIVPENTPFNISEVSHSSVSHNITGTDQRNILLFIPLGYPNFKTAVENTLAKGQGDIITNAQVSNITHWYILGGYNQIKITGDVVRLPR